MAWRAAEGARPLPTTTTIIDVTFANSPANNFGVSVTNPPSRTIIDVTVAFPSCEQSPLTIDGITVANSPANNVRFLCM